MLLGKVIRYLRTRFMGKGHVGLDVNGNIPRGRAYGVVTIKAKVIRANGKVEDLGVISKGTI